MASTIYGRLDPRVFYKRFFPEEVENAKDINEIKVICPFHKKRVGKEDTQASLSISLVENGVFHCFGCEIKGALIDFWRYYYSIENKEEATRAIQKEFELTDTPSQDINTEYIENAHQTLISSPKILQYLKEVRGITLHTVTEFKLGWDYKLGRVTIPIYDENNNILNIRKWKPKEQRKAREGKVIGITGFNLPHIFPVKTLVDNQEIILCEGELDCLLLIQNEFSAITITGAAGVFKEQWTRYFHNKDIVIIFDSDEAGKKAAIKVRNILYEVVKSIKIIDLNLQDGEDVTDYYIKYNKSSENLKKLIIETEPFFRKVKERDTTVYEVNLFQAGSAHLINKWVRLKAIIAGKEDTPYAIPSVISATCEGNVKSCTTCPAQDPEGIRVLDIKKYDKKEIIIDLLFANKTQETSILKKVLNICKKGNSRIEVEEQDNIEEIRVIPELSFTEAEYEYVVRTIYYMGYGLKLNEIYDFKGIVCVEPKTKRVTLLALEAKPAEASVDKFDVDNEIFVSDEKRLPIKEALTVFQCDSQDVDSKMKEIYHDLMCNVTRIYDRKDMLIATDLCFYSAVSFYLFGKAIKKGWLDVLLLGDTKTGKTETVERLLEHNRCGEMLSGENLSRVGLAGGYVSLSGSKMRFVLGRFPLNDRRLVAIDEFGGLLPEQIGELTRIRSQGIVESAKLGQFNKAYARVRLISMANPRNNRQLSSYGYGILALPELIGADADISRWDMVVTSSIDEVPSEVYNTLAPPSCEHIYKSELCHNLILFAWSRKPENYIFTKDAEEAIIHWAIILSDRYIEEIPLIISTEIKYTLARIGIAIATRLFSTENFRDIIINENHIVFAAKFLDEIYSKKNMAYNIFSEHKKIEYSLPNELLIEDKLNRLPKTFSDFLLLNDKFTRQDIEDFAMLDQYGAKDIISFLIENRCVRKITSVFYTKTPGFNKWIKEKYVWKPFEDTGMEGDFKGIEGVNTDEEHWS